jgi:uncharacterized protein YkwD
MPYFFQMRKYLFLIAFVSFSCSKPIPPEEELLLSSKEEFLKFINKARASSRKCGTQNFVAANPVTWNSNLEKAAYLHSKDMSENNYFSHTAKNGSDPSIRILAQNYEYKAYAENIYAAFGFTPTPEEITTQWISSPTHCVNIMTPDFKEMGVGGYQNHWTQLFGLK